MWMVRMLRPLAVRHWIVGDAAVVWLVIFQTARLLITGTVTAALRPGARPDRDLRDVVGDELDKRRSWAVWAANALEPSCDRSRSKWLAAAGPVVCKDADALAILRVTSLLVGDPENLGADFRWRVRDARA